jgi:hypothetical protein
MSRTIRDGRARPVARLHADVAEGSAVGLLTHLVHYAVLGSRFIARVPRPMPYPRLGDGRQL